MQYINHKRFVLVDVLFSVMQVNVHGVWVDGQAQQLHASASWTFRLVTFFMLILRSTTSCYRRSQAITLSV
jgi:hypothetical protein